MYLVISLLVLRAGCGIWLHQFLIIAYLFTFKDNYVVENTRDVINSNYKKAKGDQLFYNSIASCLDVQVEREGAREAQRVPDRSLHQHPSNQVHLVHDSTENVV